MSDVRGPGDANSISPNTRRLVSDEVRRSFRSQPQGLETRHQERVKELIDELKKAQPDAQFLREHLSRIVEPLETASHRSNPYK